MALAVAFVACQGAVGKQGEPGKDAPAATPANTSPRVDQRFVDQTLMLGTTYSWDLTEYFSDSDTNDVPAFTVAVDPEGIVNATTTDDNKLRLETANAGMAEVTVTATDAGGLQASDTFKVTVEEPESEPEVTDCDGVEISGADKPEVNISDCLPDDADASMYELETTDDSVFSVAKHKDKDHTYVITAVSRGEADAEIVSKEDGEVAHEIPVTVNNRPPMIDGDAGNPPHADIEGPSNHPKLETLNRDDTKLMLYKVTIDPDEFFKDPDQDDNEQLMFKVSSSNRHVLVRSGSPCESGSDCEVWVDFLKELSDREFNLRVMAVDPRKAESPLLEFPVDVLEPASQTYVVSQPASNNLRRIHVGSRRDVNHSMTFDSWMVGVVDTLGFRFAVDYHDDLSDDYQTAPTDMAAPALVTEAPTDGVHIGDTDKTVAIQVERSGRVKSVTLTEATLASGSTNDPEIKFSVSGAGAGTVKVTYYFSVAKAGSAAEAAQKWVSVSRTLAVNVVTVE